MPVAGPSLRLAQRRGCSTIHPQNSDAVAHPRRRGISRMSYNMCSVNQADFAHPRLGAALRWCAQRAQARTETRAGMHG